MTRYGGGDLGRRRGLAVTALLLALPGSTYLYQGEELGLDETDVPDALRQDPVFLRTGGTVGGRDGCRTPVPWTPDGPGFGFTTGDPWLPMPPEAATHNAQAQAADPGSVLAAYRRLLAARREVVLGLPDEVVWLPAPADVVAVRRGDLHVVLNTASEAVEVQVEGAGRLVEATADGAQVDADGVVTVPAAATVWLRGSTG